MSTSKTINLPKGFILTVTADEFTSGSCVYLRNPGESSEDIVYITPSKTKTLGPFNEQRYYSIVSDTGLLVSSQVFSGMYTKEDATRPSEVLIRVDALDDLPTPVNGVITLESDAAYQFTKDIDLLGDRIVGGMNTAILGTSSETTSLTSTGLGVGVALYTTTGTTPIQNISFKDVDTAFDIDGGDTSALDWTAFNILNVPNIGTIKNVTNWILSDSAFLSSKGLIFDGNIGTIGISNSLFVGDGDAGDIINIAATTTITRRFRLIYSSLVVTGSTTGVNVSVSATIPVEGYILDTLNFTGGGTYTSGVTFSDNKTKFIECKGVTNSANISSYSMLNNATATVISVVDTPVKVLGTTAQGSLTQRFTHSNNKLVFDGAIVRDFFITATASLVSGNNKVIGLQVAMNGSVVTDSKVLATTNSGGRAESISVQAIVQLGEDDYIEMFVENTTDTANVTVESLSVIVSALN